MQGMHSLSLHAACGRDSLIAGHTVGDGCLGGRLQQHAPESWPLYGSGGAVPALHTKDC